MKKSELFISVDIEADGRVPGLSSMISLGSTVVGNTDKRFYVEIKPISDTYDPECLAVSGLKREDLIKNGVDPREAMYSLSEWVKDVSAGYKPVLVGFNAGFDWQFVNYYFWEFLGENPFGVAPLDIKAYCMGKFGSRWSNTNLRTLDEKFIPGVPHTHNALEDAIKQAMLFEKVRDYRGSTMNTPYLGLLD